MASAAAAAAGTSAARRVFIITGANTGVGYQTARQLALGADDAREPRLIILACRTAYKAGSAVKRIQQELGAQSLAQVEYMLLDLLDYKSITHFAAEFKQRKLPLHVLVNNAGVNAAPRSLPQPFQCNTMWVANYVSHVLLTDLLLPVLEASAPSRVVNITSFMHRFGRNNWQEDWRASHTMQTYSNTKLAQVYHAHELQRRYASKGVHAFLAHPGACNSDILLTVEPAWARKLFLPIARALFLTTEQGAKSSVKAATTPATGEVQHYTSYRVPLPALSIVTDGWQPSCLARVTESRTSDTSYDAAEEGKLWKQTHELIDEWAESAQAH